MTLRRRPLLWFVLIAFAFSWAFWAVGSIVPAVVTVTDAIATFGPAVAAVVMTAALAEPGARPRAVLGLVRRLVPKAAFGWYLLALLLFPAISLLGLGILDLLGVDRPLPLEGVSIDSIILLGALVFTVTLLTGGPLGEEIGWRGFLLPQAQRRWSPLSSSLVVGLIWGVWHLPLHLRGMYDVSMGEGLAGIGLRLLSSTSLAVLFTWFYNRTRGDLAVMVLLHTSVNNTSGFWLPVHDGVQLVLIPLLVVLVVVDRMYRRLPIEAPVLREEQQQRTE